MDDPVAHAARIPDLESIRSAALALLEAAVVQDERGEPCGTIASVDDPQSHYANIWTRDNVGPMLYFLRHHPDRVRGLLEALIRRQSRGRRTLGLIPIGFSPQFDAIDYGGEESIGAIHSIDSTLWFLILLGLYLETTGDLAWLAGRREALDLALGLVLAPRFDPMPLLAAPESVTEIDRPAGLYGYPLQLQVLLGLALRWSARMLSALEPGSETAAFCVQEAEAVQSWINRWYWLDETVLAERRVLPGERHGKDNPNPFNLDYARIEATSGDLSQRGGYLAGTVRTRHLDTRLWTFPNCLAAATQILSPARIDALLHRLERDWDLFVEGMPMAVCWPPLVGPSYEILMDGDARARPQQYHNGARWPNGLWPFAAACLSRGRADLAERARAIAARGLLEHWGEFYDCAGHLGEGARTHQTWSIAGYLVADEALAVGIDTFWQIRLLPPEGWLSDPASGA